MKLGKNRAFWAGLLLIPLSIALYLMLTDSYSVPEHLQGSAADPATFLSPEEVRQGSLYNDLRNGLFLLSFPWEWAIYLLLLGSRSVQRLSEMWLVNRRFYVFRFVGYVWLIHTASYLLYLPIRLISYRLSKHYGISVQPAADWLRDQAISYSLDFVLLAAVSAVVFAFMRKNARNWWFKVWLLSIPFTLFMMIIQPVVIDPLYDEFTRLSDPVLEEKILSLAEQSGISTDRVYEVKVSDKTNAMNAYVNGLGTSLRIVLWDTTLQRLTEEQILLIMAHEIGHYVMHHLEWSAVGAIASLFILLWAGSILLRLALAKWGERWQLKSAADLRALPLLLLIVSVLSFASLPFSNAVSRQAERAADRYALAMIPDGEAGVRLYQDMAKASLREWHPPLLIRLLGSTHPSYRERILYHYEHLQSNAAGQEP
ncbi:M48 family peptidase [Xylanibacillus composti]|uniref:Metalloprotease n=1 Tax=Xylanibacillus composti TaxID=1572762 RepID=A0A8J4H2H8_9BACL|nr:M48 family metallopeptidase [Xylanibacillus composti]MDT9725669.1 M48 family peptidase [Xylanibacillus composti]GIQ67764.1 metalloprotease [Xylanibacillus composti]